MRAGRLRHRVRLERLTAATDGPATDSYGAAAGPWEPYAVDVPASVEPFRGQEFHAAAQNRSKVSHRVRMRDRSDIAYQDRIVTAREVLVIEAVIPPRKVGDELQAMCSAYVPTVPDGHPAAA